MWHDKEAPPESVPITWGYRRPATTEPAVQEAEAALALRYGWNLPFFRGQRAATDTGGSCAFALVGELDPRSAHATSIDMLRVSEWKRFGNAVRQLKNVFLAARRYEVSSVEFPSPHPFFSGSVAGPFRLTWTALGRAPVPKGLEGEFFSLLGLGFRPTPEQEAGVLKEIVRPLLVPQMKADPPALEDVDMVLHFRGGDVFKPPIGHAPHRGYGQPPLAYYLAAVAREKPSRVRLVFQDRNNPTVAAAEAVLRTRGIDVLMQSSSLGADLRVLLNARCLVGSFGSFCQGIAALSTRVQRFYQFGPPIPALRLLGIHLVEGVDEPGDYRRAVASNNWAATPAQLALMTEYAEEAIRFVDYPPLG